MGTEDTTTQMGMDLAKKYSSKFVEDMSKSGFRALVIMQVPTAEGSCAYHSIGSMDCVSALGALQFSELLNKMSLSKEIHNQHCPKEDEE